MKEKLTYLLIGLIALSLVIPGVIAVSTGGNPLGVDITVEEFEPLVWLCDSRVVLDDPTEPGRVSDSGEELVERINNYAFRGEQIVWTVLVMDKNKIDQNIDVYATVGSTQGPEGGDIEVNCQRTGTGNFDACNAKILEEDIVWDENLMDFFSCTLTVEPSWEGEFWVTVEAMSTEASGSPLYGAMRENEYWYFNPEVALSVDGSLIFDNVRPGTSSYSETILVENDASPGSGVALDMFISGTNFFDSDSTGTRCPVTNQLSLDNFRYYAVNGAYSTYTDPRSDVEGYVGINYGDAFSNVGTTNLFYDSHEILQVGSGAIAPYFEANLLAPGAELAITFRLDLPEPCNGNFDEGEIFFWGEAI
jgi:hypothetical protein